MGLTRKKEPWWKFGLKAGVALALIFGALEGFTSTFRIGTDSQKVLCLEPYSKYLVNVRIRDVGVGDFVAYKAEGLEPWIDDGQTLVKMVTAGAGDRVEIRDDGGVYVNGQIARHGLVLSKTLGHSPEDYYREFVVPEGELFVTGWHPQTFDGRYWGTISRDQIVGKSWMLW